jgi:HlyD family secretion protein
VAILSIVPEGSKVKKGDLLIELDDAALRDQVLQKEIAVAQVKSAVVAAEAEYRGVKEVGESGIRVYQMALQAAELAKDRALADGGQLAYELTTTNSEIAISKARLQAAEELLGKSSGDDSPPGVKAQLNLSIIEAREKLRVAEARKRLLENFDRKYRNLMLDLSIAEKRMQLTRHESEFVKSLQIARAQLSAREAALAVEQKQLARAKEQLSCCKIHAPQAGTVVYANVFTSRTRRNIPIQPGDRVRERQPLIRLADMNRLQMKVRVRESDIARVRVEQPVTIELDAFPDRTLRGKVIDVNRSPESQARWSDGVKRCVVLVSIEDPPKPLRLGLTAVVEIDVADQS